MISEDEVDTSNSGDIHQPPPQPPGRATMPVELSTVPGARVEWQPSDVLLEGEGGMIVEGHSLEVPEEG